MAKIFRFLMTLQGVIWVCLFLLVACNSSKKDLPKDGADYAIASPEYSVLAEKSLDLLTSFEFDRWGNMLSDSIIYYFPDGDMKTRTKLVGKAALLAWWKNYKNTSGLESMSVEGANYVPVETLGKPRDGFVPGVYVFAYFSNKMVYHGNGVALRMNFAFHFDKEKMIDRVMTYYDRTPIIKASGKNLLEIK
jgi:hypothetical protein